MSSYEGMTHAVKLIYSKLFHYRTSVLFLQYDWLCTLFICTLTIQRYPNWYTVSKYPIGLDIQKQYKNSDDYDKNSKKTDFILKIILVSIVFKLNIKYEINKIICLYFKYFTLYLFCMSKTFMYFLLI